MLLSHHDEARNIADKLIVVYSSHQSHLSGCTVLEVWNRDLVADTFRLISVNMENVDSDSNPIYMSNSVNIFPHGPLALHSVRELK